MKKLLLLAILATVPTMANAAVSVDQTTDASELQLRGYSKEITNMVNVSKYRAVGEEYYTEDELAFKKQNKFVRFWRKLYMYVDPASEDYSYYHHDIKTTPGYTDL